MRKLEGVRLVEAQERAVALGQRAHARQEPGLRQHHVAVGQRGLGQHQRDRFGRELGLQDREVVERQHASVGRGSRRQPLALGLGPAVHKVHQGLVQMPVVVPAENDQPLATGREPREAQHLGVRAGGRERRLPERQADPIGQLLRDHDRVLSGEQEVRAGRDLAADCGDDGGRSEARAHAEVADVEVGVLVAVDVAKARAAAGRRVYRRRRVEPRHPRHRHRVRQVLQRPEPQRRGARRAGREGALLAHTQFGECLAVDGGGHGDLL